MSAFLRAIALSSYEGQEAGQRLHARKRWEIAR